jgi:hypothetical protein
MQDWEIEAVRKAYATSSSDEIMEARNRAAKFPKAAETVKLLQQILEERMAEEREQSPAAWSKANTAPERAKTVTPEERQAKELARLKRISKNGTVIPFVTPESPYRDQRDYDQRTRTNTSSLKRDPRSCTTCSPSKPGPDCGGQCTQPGFWQARMMTRSEMAAADTKRGEKPLRED